MSMLLFLFRDALAIPVLRTSKWTDFTMISNMMYNVHIRRKHTSYISYHLHVEVALRPLRE